MRQHRYTVRFALDAKDSLGRIIAGQTSREHATVTVWAYNALDADVAGGKLLRELVGEERARLAWPHGARRDDFQPFRSTPRPAPPRIRISRARVAPVVVPVVEQGRLF